MGKRGPAPRGEYEGKSQVLSTRIRPDTRAELEAAAKRSGRSLSQEIEFRLRRTFQDDDRATDMFGSPRNRRLLQMVGIAMQTAFNPQRPGTDWLEDPFAFEIAKRTINKLLEGIRPPGDVPPLSIFDEGQSMNQAAALWSAIQKADTSLPINASGRQHLANVIKAELGAIAERPHIFEGTADEMRRHADNIKKAETAPKTRSRRRSRKQ